MQATFGGVPRSPVLSPPQFPFAIVLRESPDGTIEIVAIAHASRYPGFLQGR